MAISRLKLNSIIPADVNFQSVLYAAVFLSLLVLSVGLILFVSSLHLFAKKTPAVSAVISNDVSTSASSTKKLVLGINIANSGLVFLNSAKVVSISGDKKIHVSIGWGSTKFAWTVETNTSTKFFNAKGKKVLFTDIHVNDVVKVTGKLSGDSTDPLIKAEFIRIL